MRGYSWRRLSSEVELLTAFGEHLGMAYQVRDDIIDIQSIKSSSWSDISEFKTTLPIVHLYHISSERERAKLIEDFGYQSPDDPFHRKAFLKRILIGLERSNSLNYCLNIVNSYIDQAIEDLKQLRNSTFKSHLIQMADLIRIK